MPSYSMSQSTTESGQTVTRADDGFEKLDDAYRTTLLQGGILTVKKAGMSECAETGFTRILKNVNKFLDDHMDLLKVMVEKINLNSVGSSADSSSDVTKAMVKGLTLLGQLHPFIKIVTSVCVKVVGHDLTRRENDRKINLVKFQMMQLVYGLFELRRIPDSNEAGITGITIAERLRELIELIAKDIKECGSACDAYSKKCFLSKAVKSSIYEGYLIDFGMRFVKHRDDLQSALSSLTVQGIYAANQKLNEQGQIIRSVNEKLDMIALFRKLDTPREKDLQKFIDDNGGAKKCLDNEELLEKLIVMSGEGVSQMPGRDMANNLLRMQKKLQKELAEDIDELFKRNMRHFEKKLDKQLNRIDKTTQDTHHMVQTLVSGAHDDIIDPDLRNIWRTMGWKGSVKARHFVLALHDYYNDKLGSTNVLDPLAVDQPLPAPLTLPRPTRSSTATVFEPQDSDKWALAYINAAYVQPILEAFDDDGTGFISVKEVNTFVNSCPDKWSLAHWIAYWAVGWQVSVSRYKNRIYSLVQTIFQMMEDVLPSNRVLVDEYLCQPSFWRIELLLRSTRSVNPNTIVDPELAKITKQYSDMEEARLDASLDEVAYELDAPATVSLVTGEGRIERYVFPLIYLLLRRHLKVITLACKHVLHAQELDAFNDSLDSVLKSVDDRIQNLEALFKQTHLDVRARLGNFAFGIFQLSYGDIRRMPRQNTFRSWDNVYGPLGEDNLTLEAAKAEISEIPLDILQRGIQDGIQSTNYFEFESSRLGNVSHPLQGTWTGHYSRPKGGDIVSSVLRISFLITSDLQVTGKGEDYLAAFTFKGEVEYNGTSYMFKCMVVDDDGDPCATCDGFLDTETNVISLGWSNQLDIDKTHNQTFQLYQIPPSLLRFRYTPSQFAEDPSGSRWAFACNATRYQVQQMLWTRKFLQSRFKERRLFVGLTTRSLTADMNTTPHEPLLPSEKGKLEYLRLNLNPSEARFYQALAEFECRKLLYHLVGCDSCLRWVTKSRILCIQCMSDDLSDGIDLCSVCIDKYPTNRGFSHDASHDLIKVEEVLHDFDLAQVVDNARAVISRKKTLFRSIGPISTPEEETVGRLLGPTCACCSKEVSTPFWVCVVCTRDTFICRACDAAGLVVAQDGCYKDHKLKHPLVRVRDTSIAGQGVSIEDRLSTMEQRFVNLENKVAAVDAKVEARLSSLGNNVEECLSRLHHQVDRFDTLEALLRLHTTLVLSSY